jgi:uncharacterized iron-regulated protein
MSAPSLHQIRFVSLALTGLGLLSPVLCAQETAESQPVVTAIVDGEDYRVYDRQGRRTSLEAIVRAALSDDVLLVGEEHDDVVGHAFEAELFRAALRDIGGAAGAGRPVVLSLEMFERDVQYIVDEYLEGLISEDHFLRSSRPWDDYEARYRDLVEAAREGGAPVIAANAPRRYVNRVSREGPAALATLPAEARRFLPPLPYPGPSAPYLAQWGALMTEAMAGTPESEGDPFDPHGNIVQAQALWDASMGHAITEALVSHLGGLVLHFAGSFHVERDTGILERIRDYRPGTRVSTVVMTKVDDVGAWSAEEHSQLADFVVLTRKAASVTAEGSAR